MHSLLFVLLLAATGPAPALDGYAPTKCSHGYAKRAAIPAPRERNDRPIDVLLYELDLTIYAGTDSLSGTVRIDLASLGDPLPQIVLDLSNAGMQVDAVRLDGAPANYLHQDEVITITPPAPLALSALASVEIDYRGRPSRDLYGLSGFAGGYRLSVLPGADGRPDFDAPIYATLSEPTAARAWWPCHDTPYDAAQVRLSVTGPDELTLAAPGLLENRSDHGDGTATTTWFLSAEVPAYLVSIAMAEYESWTETATVTDLTTGLPVSMPVQHFVNAARRPHAEHSWQNTVEMIEYFDQLFSPYPYGDIKYGHALFNFGGAMEHPTMTSMGGAQANLLTSSIHSGPAADWIVAHELVHQWYGDSLRLSRWGEIWLNEGFASYGEVLWLEHKYGYDVGKTWLVNNKLLDYYAGTVRDPQPPLSLFGSTVYDKGAWILHMLRQLLGDADFLEALRRYADDFRFQAVTTEDFIAVCDAVHGASGGEQFVNGSLSWFFTQWLDREDRPTLASEWSQRPDDNTVRLSVMQAAPAYRLPLLVRLEYVDGSSEDRLVVIDGEQSQSELPASGELRRLSIDPEGDWLLHETTPTLASLDNATLLAPYPNPFNPRVAIGVFLRQPAHIDLAIYDLRGRLVRQLLRGLQPADQLQISWDGRDESGDAVGSAVYLVRLKSSDGSEDAKPITLLR